MLKKCSLLLLLCLVLCSGCFRHQYTMGSGFHKSSEEEIHHQWYVLWGIVPVGQDKDAGALAQSPNYQVISKFSVWDSLIHFFSVGIVSRRTIYIQK
mgnify:CR=1 FL=1